MIRIAHVITNLGTGGAETMLYRLVSALDRKRFQSEVISLGDRGPMGDRIESQSASVHAIGTGRRRNPPVLFSRLFHELRRMRPDLLQTWMYHANVLGSAAGFLLQIPVIWNVRRGSLSCLKRSTKWIATAGAGMSAWVPRRIVCCSSEAVRSHVGAGYPRDKMTVIPNGFDTLRFRPEPTARASLRRELGVPEGTPVIGHVARFDPAKDHRTFLRAARLLHEEIPDLRFLLCGEGITQSNRSLSDLIEEFGLRPYCHLLGLREDVPRVMAGLDVLVSSSVTEGFPNVIGEAMACGTPCVATNVGDTELLLGDLGLLVPAGEPAAMAQACAEMLRKGTNARKDLGRSTRERIEKHFQLEQIVRHYEDLYGEVLAGV